MEKKRTQKTRRSRRQTPGGTPSPHPRRFRSRTVQALPPQKRTPPSAKNPKTSTRAEKCGDSRCFCARADSIDPGILAVGISKLATTTANTNDFYGGTYQVDFWRQEEAELRGMRRGLAEVEALLWAEICNWEFGLKGRQRLEEIRHKIGRVRQKL